jgi:ribonuclease D
MSASLMKKPVWIDRPHTLDAMVKDLVRYPLLAVDTESNSLYVYREQVCLIQFSTGETDYLVDPLALTDLSPLSPIFADPSHRKDLSCRRI